MAFANIVKVEKPDFYLKTAFTRANKVASLLRPKIKLKNVSTFDKSKKIEIEKISVVKEALTESFNKLLKSFPMVDQLTPFYNDLVKYTIGTDDLRNALGAVNWAKKKISEICSIYTVKIRKTEDSRKINNYRNECYGRISSVAKQIKKYLELLEEARKSMKDFPPIKSGLFTVAIVGFPNVGKTTLLRKLSKSKPEVAEYPFTSKGVNIGYLEYDGKKMQLLDTPGTLNRFEKMNVIEMHAYLAMRHCAELFVYVFDPTEQYPMELQQELCRNVRKFDRPMICYVSKMDMNMDKEDADKIVKKYNAIVSIDELKKILIEKCKELHKEPEAKKEETEDDNLE